MKFFTIIYRTTTKLTQGTSGLIAKIQTYFYNKKTLSTDVNVLYQDGLYSINTNSKILAIENDFKNLYSLLYQDTEALKIIKSFGLQEKDIFLGREGVYILFKNNEKAMSLVGDTISLIGGKIAIKNDTTDLKTILTQNIAIDNAFFTSLSTALAQSNFVQFQASLTPTIATYIAQKTAVNNLIISLLNS